MRAVGRITATGQTTIPHDIRVALNVSAGDLIGWEIRPDGTAIVRRIKPVDIEHMRALERTLSEWSGAADEEAYGDL
jgi:antitoxin PrlF